MKACRHRRLLEVRTRVFSSLAVALGLAVAAPVAQASESRSAATKVALAAGKADEAATAGALQAFVLTSSPDSFADLQAHPGAVGVIYPTYFQCAVPSGVVQGSGDPEVDAA